MANIKRKEFYTTSEIAKILHVAVGSVINWVDDNEINAIVTPGGHRKIPYKELIRFLESHNYDIPQELLQKKMIILIDDEEDIHNFFVSIFKNIEGFELKSFYSGTDALMFIGKRAPEVIVVDILMPDVDGLEVIKNIRANAQYKGMKILAISADIAKKDPSLKAGATAFLKKPFNIEDFRDAISKLED
ncbi:MAG: response regulator [Spirochaetes bacterium]|nr:response regulator [Spirochaetota bacterium]